MGMCMACMICPVTFCSSCVTTSLDARRRAVYDREPLFMSNNWRLMMALLASLSIGCACYIYMSVKCTERHKLGSWSPYPLDYEHGPCFSTADGYMAGTGLFSAILMGTSFGAICVFAIEFITRGTSARNQSRLPDRNSSHIPPFPASSSGDHDAFTLSQYSPSSAATTTISYPQHQHMSMSSANVTQIALNPLNATNVWMPPPPSSSSEAALSLKS